MHGRDYRDVVGGLLATGGGVFVFFYAWANYDLGTLAHMGPGLFPAALGFVMAAMGAVVLVPALFRKGEALKLKLRPVIAIVASIAVFALTIGRFGLVPAVVATVVVSSLAETRPNVLTIAILAAALAGLGVLIFVVALGLPIPLFAWKP